MKKIILLVLAAMILSAACCACAEDPFHFATFSDALSAVRAGDGGKLTVSGEDCAVAEFEKDGRVFRAVAFFDDRAKELRDAFVPTIALENRNFPNDEYRALEEYVLTLPVQYTEELNVIPFSQEELDAMVGKTIEEIMSEPWEMGMMHYPDDAEAGKDIIFPMVKGFCEYELVINEPFEVYQERRARDHYDPVTMMSLRNYLNLTVKCVRYSGISSNTLDLRYHADGTWTPETEPEDVNEDLVLEIADLLDASWENTVPDRAAREAMIVKLTEKHPEDAEIIRLIVESFESPETAEEPGKN